MSIRKNGEDTDETTTLSTSSASGADLFQALGSLTPIARDGRCESAAAQLRSYGPAERQRVLSKTSRILKDQDVLRILRNESHIDPVDEGYLMLKALAHQALHAAFNLLDDPQEEIVLQTVLLLDSLGLPAAMRPLVKILEGSRTVNVRQAAILAIGHLRDPASLPHLLPFLQSDPWLQLATVQALADIGCRMAIPALKPLLYDGFVGPLAVEAVAKLGGGEGFIALAEYWQPFLEMLDGRSLELLASVAETIDNHAGDFAEIRSRLCDRLSDPDFLCRVASARCLLTLGPNAADSLALSVIAKHWESAPLPACLTRRVDLIPYLLGQPGVAQVWGHELQKAARLSAGNAY